MKSILLVEDDCTLREALEWVLADHGYVVLPTPGLREARRLFASGPPGLVLVDLHGGAMDGVMAVREVRAAWREVPIVCVTAQPPRFAFGATVVLERPFHLDELLVRLATLFPESAAAFI